MKMIVLLGSLVLSMTGEFCQGQVIDSGDKSPRIVNIINFIRQTEPRIDWITEDVLYETVVEQIKIMQRHQLRGTFLLQYDALIEYPVSETAAGTTGRDIRDWRVVGNSAATGRKERLPMARAVSLGLACRRRVCHWLLAGRTRGIGGYVYG